MGRVSLPHSLKSVREAVEKISDYGRNLFRAGWKTAHQALTFTGAISSFDLPEPLREESEAFFLAIGGAF